MVVSVTINPTLHRAARRAPREWCLSLRRLFQVPIEGDVTFSLGVLSDGSPSVPTFTPNGGDRRLAGLPIQFGVPSGIGIAPAVSTGRTMAMVDLPFRSGRDWPVSPGGLGRFWSKELDLP
jgi:hypothetical protein